MTDRLRALLSENRTKIDRDFGNETEGMDEHDRADAHRDSRLALVRETMLECAKVMCESCRHGHPVFQDGELFRHGTYMIRRDCKAADIHAILAEKGTDNG